MPTHPEVHDIFGIPCIFRKCGECGGDVLVMLTPDGPDPAPTSCTEHAK